MGQILVNGYWNNICWIIMFTGIVCSMQYLLFNQKNILRQSLFQEVPEGLFFIHVSKGFKKTTSKFVIPRPGTGLVIQENII